VPAPPAAAVVPDGALVATVVVGFDDEDFDELPHAAPKTEIIARTGIKKRRMSPPHERITGAVERPYRHDTNGALHRSLGRPDVVAAMTTRPSVLDLDDILTATGRIPASGRLRARDVVEA
jgi:hypothetical protein